MKYLLDANIFIEAYKRYYSESIVPSFWNFLIDHLQIFTIQQVKEEIKKGKDELPQLIEKVKIYPNTDFDDLSISDHILSTYNREEERRKFLDSPDFILVGLSINKREELTIVTHEKLLGKGSKKISIPNICKRFELNHCNTFEMLNELNIQLGTEYKDS